MINLSDTQRVVLSSAAQRGGGSIFPLPTCLKAGGGVARSVDKLLTHGFAEECETSDPAAVHRTDGDVRYGLFITLAGLAAIGIGDEDGGGDGATVEATPAAGAKVSKTAMVLDLLGRLDGATVAELIEATDWLPHTTRAALTGLRKKGHVIERSKRSDATCYRIPVAG